MELNKQDLHTYIIEITCLSSQAHSNEGVMCFTTEDCELTEQWYQFLNYNINLHNKNKKKMVVQKTKSVTDSTQRIHISGWYPCLNVIILVSTDDPECLCLYIVIMASLLLTI